MFKAPPHSQLCYTEPSVEPAGRTRVVEEAGGGRHRGVKGRGTVKVAWFRRFQGFEGRRVLGQ